MQLKSFHLAELLSIPEITLHIKVSFIEKTDGETVVPQSKLNIGHDRVSESLRINSVQQLGCLESYTREQANIQFIKNIAKVANVSLTFKFLAQKTCRNIAGPN